MSATAKRLQLCLALVALSTSLLAVRIWGSGTITYAFLLWNVGLAAVPTAVALALRALVSARRRAAALGAFAVWLCFLPNAPYIVTDFVHLQFRAPIPVWYDAALLAAFAVAGLVLGYASVAEVRSALADEFGERVASLVAFGSLFLCGFGVYVGRFLRWNSWDIVTDPLPLARVVAHGLLDPLGHPTGLAISVAYGLALMVGYTLLRRAASPLVVDGQQ